MLEVDYSNKDVKQMGGFRVMTTIEGFAVRLTELREKKKLKRQEVADSIGISRASLEYYEKGKRKPDVEVALKLADFYGVTCDYLIRGVRSEFVGIQKTTGLSDKAIETLSTFKKFQMDNYIKIVNFLIEETEYKSVGEGVRRYEKNVLQKLYEYFLYKEPEKEYLYIVTSDGEVFREADNKELEQSIEEHYSREEKEELYIEAISGRDLIEVLRYDKLTEQIKESKKKFIQTAGDLNGND